MLKIMKIGLIAVTPCLGHSSTAGSIQYFTPSCD